jgi:signal transduction histidine kinase
MEALLAVIERGKYQWETTFDAITAPVLIVSRDYRILRGNRNLAEVSNQDIRKMIDKHCYEAFAGRSSPCPGCPLKRALTSGRQLISGIETPIHRCEFEASAYPLAAEGIPESAVVHYRDITEERRLQREVIQQEKMAAIGMLAGGVAHEINNPLGGILAFTQLIKREVAGNEGLVRDLTEVENAAQRCKKIVADLLDFSRSSRDGERTLTDINILLEKVFPFVQREMRSQNVDLEFRGGSGLAMVMANPDRLQQVFLNLMTNACHAMPKGGRLTVETGMSLDSHFVLIRVRDTGMGVPREIRDRIFDPFFTTKEPGKGTGLGLSISYRIIRDQGGKIVCESEEGRGTEFTVHLPAAER